MIRIRLIIRGCVQGVFFRSSAQQKALELGVTGWIGNCADGTVQAVVEGPDNLVNQFVEWCASGPSTAQVERVEVVREAYTAEFEGFEIRY
ncbi:acylphosphatase [Candidatus Peregrinibacteria bacterium]|nr:acylphosphatase [Candidatus Peregrinibacteria bacterium]